MNRRNTLKTIGTVGVAGALGIGMSGVASADRSDDGRTGRTNPGRIGTYNGTKALTSPDLGGSEHPILPLDMPAGFNSDLFHDEWGEGQVRGTTNVPGGGIRNVITFPLSL